jgi:hypothetical protein
MAGALFGIQITGWTAMIIIQITGDGRAFSRPRKKGIAKQGLHF